MGSKTTSSQSINVSGPISSELQLEAEQLTKLMYTPLAEAVSIVHKRKTDVDLVNRVHKYLGGDIPDHFLGDKPIGYLSRFFATPNYELLHVAEITKRHKLQLVVGEDRKSKFNDHNELKRHLAKLRVHKGLSHNKDDIVEYFTIADFNAIKGLPLCDIKTIFGISLEAFHKELMAEMVLSNTIVADETDWVDRNHRDDIFTQYKKMWAIVSVHGIIFESITADEHIFLKEIMYPSFKEVADELGVKPLIVEHITPEMETEKNWNTYPSVLYQYIKRQF